MYVHALGQNLVVINSAEVAEDLLAKRSRIYSDRPEITVMGMYVFCRLCRVFLCQLATYRAGWHINMGLKHYGEEWRRDRRIMQQRLRREETSVLHPVHLNKCKALLHDLLTDQAHFEEHFKRYVLRLSLEDSFSLVVSFPASVMTYAVYGHNAEPQDELLELTYETIGLFSGALFPGTNLLNMCPPREWCPKRVPHSLNQTQSDISRHGSLYPFFRNCTSAAHILVNCSGRSRTSLTARSKNPWFGRVTASLSSR